MTLVYQSTRDAKNTVTASQAILQGLATDGGRSEEHTSELQSQR